MNGIEALIQRPEASRVGLALLGFVWQGALLWLVAVVMLQLLRRASAATRYVALLGLLAIMVACPMVSFFSLAPTAPTPLAAPIASTTVNAPASRPVLPVVSHDAVASANTAPEQHSISLAMAMTTLQRGLQAHLGLIALLWLIGVMVLALRLALGWGGLVRMRRRWVDLEGEDWQRLLNSLSTRLGLTRPVRLMQSARATAPLVVGWLRPVILLPMSALSGLAPELLAAVLAHELAHIRRYDYLVNLVQTLAETLFFYHPAVWWVSRRIRIEREHCCDDIAAVATGSVAQYARALAELEHLRAGVPNPAVAAVGGSVSDRLARFAGARPHRGMFWGSGVVAISLLLAIALGVGLRAQALTAEAQARQAKRIARAKVQVQQASARAAQANAQLAKAAARAKQANTNLQQAAARLAVVQTQLVQLRAKQLKTMPSTERRRQAQDAALQARAAALRIELKALEEKLAHSQTDQEQVNAAKLTDADGKAASEITDDKVSAPDTAAPAANESARQTERRREEAALALERAQRAAEMARRAAEIEKMKDERQQKELQRAAEMTRRAAEIEKMKDERQQKELQRAAEIARREAAIGQIKDWTPLVQGRGLTVSGSPHAFKVTISPEASDVSGLGIFRAGFASTHKLRGDFDIQVDYELLDWPLANGVRVGLATDCGQVVRQTNSDTDASITPRSYVEAYCTNLGGFSVVTDYWCVGELKITPTDDHGGTLRLVRQGSRLTGYMRHNDEWVKIGSAAASTADTGFALLAWSHNASFGHRPVRVALRNFVINSGALVLNEPTR
jgi:beta-lactamase regulating signal transducer with metallopeptidase domain